MQVLDRGEKIELLVDKTENLHNQVCVTLCHYPGKCLNMCMNEMILWISIFMHECCSWLENESISVGWTMSTILELSQTFGNIVANVVLHSICACWQLSISVTELNDELICWKVWEVIINGFLTWDDILITQFFF